MSKGVAFILGMLFAIAVNEIVTVKIIETFGGMDTYRGVFYCSQEKIDEE